MADQTFKVLSSEPLTILLSENCKHVITWSSWPFNIFGLRIGLCLQFISMACWRIKAAYKSRHNCTRLTTQNKFKFENVQKGAFQENIPGEHFWSLCKNSNRFRDKQLFFRALKILNIFWDFHLVLSATQLNMYRVLTNKLNLIPTHWVFRFSVGINLVKRVQRPLTT